LQKNPIKHVKNYEQGESVYPTTKRIGICGKPREQNRLKKEVITTSNMKKKKVAPATAPATKGAAAVETKKSSGKRK